MADPGRDRPVLLDGVLVPEGEAVVSAFDRGLMYGESLFETLKVVDGAPCLWPEHLERLTRSCARLGLPLDAAGLEAGVRALLDVVPVEHGALRVQVTGGVQPSGGRGLVAPEAGRRPRVIGRVDAVPQPAADVYEEGVAVVTAMELCRPLPELKSGSYLASLVARRRAADAAAFECVLTGAHPSTPLLERELLEGSVSNVLGLRDGALIPGGVGRSLPGVTLKAALDEAVVAGWDLEDGGLWYEAALAEGFLLTSSLIGVCPVSSLDGADLPDRAAEAAELRALLRAREEHSRRRWRDGHPSAAVAAVTAEGSTAAGAQDVSPAAGASADRHSQGGAGGDTEGRPADAAGGAAAASEGGGPAGSSKGRA